MQQILKSNFQFCRSLKSHAIDILQINSQSIVDIDTIELRVIYFNYFTRLWIATLSQGSIFF
jgi:hypothetical protein